MSSWLAALTVATAVGIGLMAGLFWSFSTAVMPGLADLDSAEGMAAMQRINRAILNPLFLVVFLASSLLGVVLAVSTSWTWDEPGAGYRLAGGVLAVVGNLGLTAIYHVPRNNALDQAVAGTPDGEAVWASYLREWVRWNHVRATACAVSLLLLLLAA